MSWACDIDGTRVQLHDIKLGTVLTLITEETPTEEVVIQLYAQPLNNFNLAIRIAEVCAGIAGVDDPAGWVAAYMDRGWVEFTELFVQVEDDLPTVVEDGIPPVGADT